MKSRHPILNIKDLPVEILGTIDLKDMSFCIDHVTIPEIKAMLLALWMLRDKKK